MKLGCEMEGVPFFFFSFLWISFVLSTLTSVTDFYPWYLPLLSLSLPTPSFIITIWVLLLGTQPSRFRHNWQYCTGM